MKDSAPLAHDSGHIHHRLTFNFLAIVFLPSPVFDSTHCLSATPSQQFQPFTSFFLQCFLFLLSFPFFLWFCFAMFPSFFRNSVRFFSSALVLHRLWVGAQNGSSATHFSAVNAQCSVNILRESLYYTLVKRLISCRIHHLSDYAFGHTESTIVIYIDIARIFHQNVIGLSWEEFNIKHKTPD